MTGNMLLILVSRFVGTETGLCPEAESGAIDALVDEGFLIDPGPPGPQGFTAKATAYLNAILNVELEETWTVKS